MVRTKCHVALQPTIQGVAPPSVSQDPVHASRRHQHLQAAHRLDDGDLAVLCCCSLFCGRSGVEARTCFLAVHVCLRRSTPSTARRMPAIWPTAPCRCLQGTRTRQNHGSEALPAAIRCPGAGGVRRLPRLQHSGSGLWRPGPWLRSLRLFHGCRWQRGAREGLPMLPYGGLLSEAMPLWATGPGLGAIR